MIKLPNIDKTLEDEFYENQKNKFIHKLQEHSRDGDFSAITNYFSNDRGVTFVEEKVKSVLIGRKAQLINAISIIGKTSCKKINRAFDNLYENFTTRKLGKAWAEKIGVKICPYCNRSYIFTLKTDGIRPQYDHFFPKADYPYLAVSLYNLIPSCGICNLAKKDTDTYPNRFIYPYDDEYGTEVKFKTTFPDDGDSSYLSGTNEKFGIDIDVSGTTGDLQAKVVFSKDVLKLEKLYEKHKDYVRDIIRNCRIYSDAYVESLLLTYPELFKSRDEVKNVLLMNYLQQKDWDKRVLSKLTFDISKEFGIS